MHVQKRQDLADEFIKAAQTELDSTSSPKQQRASLERMRERVDPCAVRKRFSSIALFEYKNSKILIFYARHK